MKSITSSDALQSSLELAKSNVPLELPDPNALLSVKPLPSSKFFLTLSFGSADTFLASAPGNFPLQPIKKRQIIVKKKIID